MDFTGFSHEQLVKFPYNSYKNIIHSKGGLNREKNRIPDLESKEAFHSQVFTTCESF